MLAVALLVPLLLTIAAVLVTVSLAASGPARIVTHWSVNNQPDEYGSPLTGARRLVHFQCSFRRFPALGWLPGFGPVWVSLVPNATPSILSTSSIRG
jgi:hypothetical protein